MGKSEAARAAGISPTLWVTLERGYEVKRNSRFNANPKADTVVRAARAVRLDVDEALRLTGHTRGDITDDALRAEIDLPPAPDLATIPDDDLLAELARRVRRAGRREGRVTVIDADDAASHEGMSDE
jgi:hypothetical protein